MKKNNKYNLTKKEKEIIMNFLKIYDEIESTLYSQIFYYFYIDKNYFTIIKISITLEIYPKYIHRQIFKLNKIIEIIIQKLTFNNFNRI